MHINSPKLANCITQDLNHLYVVLLTYVDDVDIWDPNFRGCLFLLSHFSSYLGISHTQCAM